MKAKIKLLYFYPTKATFIIKDIRLLSEQYEVIGSGFEAKKKYLLPIYFLKQLQFIFSHGFKANAFVCMFGGYHSFLPCLFAKITNKPSVIILGGTDCVSFPSINYGLIHKFPINTFLKWSYNLTDYFAPVHSSLIEVSSRYYDVDGSKQGIKAHFPALNPNYREVFNGYDAKKFRKISDKKPNSFITVASGLNNSTRFKLKGVDLIFEIASSFPHCQFTIVGMKTDSRLNTPSNVYLLPEVKNDELIKLYSDHEFYFQLSISEGFPNALCESMLCQCVPIGSNVTSIPFIIGDTGFIVDKRDTSLLKAVITEALSSDKEKLSMAARNRISTLFTEEIRKTELNKLIANLISS